MSDEPITFVIERFAGREYASIIYGAPPDWLTAKGSTRLVYARRLDKVPNGAAIARRPLAELSAEFGQLREAGKLPPSNLTDPPRKTEGGQKGSERGPDTWWKPPVIPVYEDPRTAKVKAPPPPPPPATGLVVKALSAGAGLAAKVRVPVALTLLIGFGEGE